MAFSPHEPKFWRPIKREKPPSIDSLASSVEGYTFGMKVPIVDFFDYDYITKFAPLEDILRGQADEIMEGAYKHDPTEKLYLPITSGGYNFRWIHVPTNNMVWLEEIIKRVCESKEEMRAKKAKKEKNTLKRKPLKAGIILSPKYWKDQQRGCIEHCANNLLYARHMKPFFADIRTDWGTETRALKELPELVVPVEDVFPTQISISTRSGLGLNTRMAAEPNKSTATDQNFVLFMPYLHWATSGEGLDHRNAVVKELTEKFQNPFYRRPTLEQIEDEETTIKMKILRAFLHPRHDRSLHLQRTLDQYYYSNLADANERTVDQVVYKFAKKQHNKSLEAAERAKEQEKEWAREQEKREKEDAGSSLRSGIVWDTLMETEEMVEQKTLWDPPKVMMVNQLWMWVIDGDTVITSFPSKPRSDLSIDDRANEMDYMEGDDIYDSTDIWRAVQRELRHQTTYGQRTAKSALDLAWTIADQARGVFQKRNLHPHLQFIQMFEMEINDITFRQEKALATFSTNVLAAHNSNNIGNLLGLLSAFRKENFGTDQVQTWKDNFRVFAINFKRRFKQTVSEAQAQAKVQGKFWPDLEPAEVNHSTSFKRFNIDDILASDIDEIWTTGLKMTYCQLQETIENARSIHLTNEDIEAQLLDCLLINFIELERIVQTDLSTASLNKYLNSLVEAALTPLDLYTATSSMEHLFDVTTEMNLITGIKNIMHELSIISSIGSQQTAVMKPFTRDMLHHSLDALDESFHDNTRWEDKIEELQKTAQSTYTALQDLLDIKQTQATARAARNDAKFSARQADAATSLSSETLRQGWAIMIFTTVTIIFLPLSFFTGLFGMNAKELTSGAYSIGFYSAIMYPVSLVIICLSLSLALKPRFRTLVNLVLKSTMSLNWWLGLWLRFRVRRRGRRIVPIGGVGWGV